MTWRSRRHSSIVGSTQEPAKSSLPGAGWRCSWHCSTARMSPSCVTGHASRCWPHSLVSPRWRHSLDSGGSSSDSGSEPAPGEAPQERRGRGQRRQGRCRLPVVVLLRRHPDRGRSDSLMPGATMSSCARSTSTVSGDSSFSRCSTPLGRRTRAPSARRRQESRAARR